MSGPALDLHLYTPAIQDCLSALETSVLPLTAIETSAPAVAAPLRNTPAHILFPGARDPEAAVSGLLLLLNQWDASHGVSQNVETREGSYWHAIAHRIEPDSFNAAYWFRRVGNHPIFPDLQREASSLLAASPQVGWKISSEWDPFRFIEWCEEARQQPGSVCEQLALAMQKCEWQLLFRWCSQSPR